MYYLFDTKCYISSQLNHHTCSWYRLSKYAISHRAAVGMLYTKRQKGVEPLECYSFVQARGVSTTPGYQTKSM